MAMSFVYWMPAAPRDSRTWAWQLRQQPLHSRDDRVERHLILAALRDDQVGVPLRRFDELLVHRTHRVQILLNHGFERAASRLNVAHEAAHETDVGGRIDKQLDVDPLAQLGFRENENAFDDDHPPRF